MDIAERIAELMKVYNHTAATLAEALGVQRSGLSHILNGRNKPSMDFIEKLLTQFKDSDARWLITGEPAGSVAVSQPAQSQSAKSSKKEDLPNKRHHTKQVERIVVFYADHTFDSYEP